MKQNANAAAHPNTSPLFVDRRSQAIIERLDRVAPSDASILIVGETGTGKEVMAREIHARSGRAGPFVAVNCGALSDALGEAALFGHEAGAYTGATSARAGWFEAANGGTLFLDEIGDLSASLQVALLRVLQERQVVRLGSRKPLPIDIRVIAATNVDVAKAVRDNAFRLDLYFRLSVVTLELPPLRARPDDILPLARQFARRFSEKLGEGAPTLDPSAQRAMLRYSWPGNVRELENVMHGAVLSATDRTIRATDLRLVPWIAGEQGDEGKEVERDSIGAALDRVFATRPHNLFDTIERAVVTRAFEECGGNQVRTAKLLGVSRNVLRTLLKRHGLLEPTPARETPSKTSHSTVTPFKRYPSHYSEHANRELA